MMLLVGTMPVEDLPLTFGEAALDNDYLIINGHRLSCTQGSGAMITAALTVTQFLKLNPPTTLVVGDIGDGRGTRDMFQYLIERVNALSPKVLTLHYCLPIMALVKKLCQTLDKGRSRPVLIADAGGMYATKAAGLAPLFDVFTPDPSEIAFLADPAATHPAYISKHLFDGSAHIPDQIAAAFRYKNAAKLLVVKGKTDYIAMDGQVLAVIDQPDIPALELIGGTGDTITGLVSALIYAGLSPSHAAVVAAKTNRMAGKLASPTPATPVRKIIEQFPAVLKQYLKEWTAVGVSQANLAK